MHIWDYTVQYRTGTNERPLCGSIEKSTFPLPVWEWSGIYQKKALDETISMVPVIVYYFNLWNETVCSQFQYFPLCNTNLNFAVCRTFAQWNFWILTVDRLRAVRKKFKKYITVLKFINYIWQQFLVKVLMQCIIHKTLMKHSTTIYTFHRF